MTQKVLRSINWDETKKAIRESSKETAIYVGCDSRQRKKNTYFAIVIILHLDGCHGAKVFTEAIQTRKITSLRERLLKEVEFASQAALNIVDHVGDRKFEVHLDINSDPEHKSNIVHSEAVGWIKGLGMEVFTKPDGFAATHCADHLVREHK